MPVSASRWQTRKTKHNNLLSLHRIVGSRLHGDLSLTTSTPAVPGATPLKSRSTPIPWELPPHVVTGDLDLVYDDVALENQQIR